MATQRYLNIVNGVQTQVVPNISSAGASDSGKIIALNASGTLDPTMLPSGVGADAQLVTASASISAGMLINVYNNTVVAGRPADNTSVGSQAMGYAPSSITNGATGTVNLGPGIITGLSGLTLGAIYYLGTVGSLVTTPPSGAGNVVQYIGIALSTTSLQFNPGPPITVA